MNMIKSPLQHSLDARSLRGLLVRPSHFGIISDLVKSHSQHSKAWKPPSFVMLFLVGVINIMQSLLKHRLDEP